MSATEEDTELRDLLIQNLENNGVLNKIKVHVLYLLFVSIFNPQWHITQQVNAKGKCG